MFDVKDYSELNKKKFDATATVKTKDGDFVFKNDGFTEMIHSLYTDFYLRLNDLINEYENEFIEQPEDITFIEYLNHDKQEIVGKKLKEEFINDLKGKINNKNTALFVFTLVSEDRIKIGGLKVLSFILSG